jgi:two-component system, cell cycle sensor histidine kinase and response regulator CckA
MLPASDLVEAVERLEAIRALTRSAAHDLNNHMAAILSFAELVLEALPEGHPLRSDVEEIRTAGFRAVTRTRELDRLSRQLMPIGRAA